MTSVSVDLIARSPEVGGSNDSSLVARFLDVWRTVPEVFAEASFTFDDTLCRLTLDWKPALADIEVQYARGLYRGHATVFERASATATEVCARAEVWDGRGDWDTVALRAQGCLNILLQELYLVSNIACPGACAGVYGVRHPVDSDQEDTGLRLACGVLDLAWDFYRKGPWPPLTQIPLNDARRWYDSLGVGTRQIATTRTERALFSFLQYCGCHNLQADSLLWLAHCLEALFDTPKDDVLRSLKDRIFLVHGRPSNPVEWKKHVNAFYDMRSKFVHGALGIGAPTDDERFDEAVTRHRGDLITSVGHGVALILSTFQKLVRNNWERIDFETQATGVGLESGGGTGP